MYCVSWINCGDLGTWLGAFVTLLAVWFGLRTARASTDTAIKLQRNEHARLDAKDSALRHQLAVAFDGDMYVLIGQIEFFIEKLRIGIESTNSNEIVDVIKNCCPTRGLVMVDRFAESVHVFPEIISGQLLSLLGRWDLMQNGPPLPMDTWDEIDGASRSLLAAYEIYESDLGIVRGQLREHILPGTKMTPDD